MNRPRVLLADDHRLVAEGIRRLLEPHFEVAGIVSNGQELLAAAEAVDPDVVVLDISMPVLNGIEVIRRLRATDCRAVVICLTMYNETTYAERALEGGASGFVLKRSAPSELLTAIREALNGGTYITPRVARNLFGKSRSGSPGGQKPPGELTPRQQEVLQLVADGCSAKKIAATLNISRRTAEFHKARLMEVLGVHSIAELVQYALHAAIGSH
jgi:DNA-binding NarL/FixJ family response regulator